MSPNLINDEVVYIDIIILMKDVSKFGRSSEKLHVARLNSQSKQIILNAYNYFDSLSKKSKGKGAFQRTLEVTSKALVLSLNVIIYSICIYKYYIFSLLP